VYELEATELKAVHDWTKMYERYWKHQLGRIKDRAERAAATSKRTPDGRKE
jgi:hypothetical protein